MAMAPVGLILAHKATTCQWVDSNIILAITSNNIIISKVPGEVPVVHLHNSNLA